MASGKENIERAVPNPGETGDVTRDYSNGAAYVNTSSAFAPKFVSADYPGCVFLWNADSVPFDGSRQIIDLAGGVVVESSTDNTFSRSSDGKGVETGNETGGDILTVSTGSPGLPTLGTNNALLILVGQKDASSDPFFEIGNTTNGTGIYGSCRGGAGQESWFSSNGASDYVSTATPLAASTDAAGSIIAGACSLNRAAITEAATFRDYRSYADGSELVGAGAVTGTTIDWNSGSIVQYVGSTYDVSINWGTTVYLCAVFHSADAAMLADSTIFTALAWMRANPGELWPGFMSMTAAA